MSDATDERIAQARYLSDIGRWPEALAATEAAVAADPEDATAWYWHAFVLRGHHFLDRARVAVNRALALDPEGLDARVLRAQIRVDVGHVQGARTDVDAVLAAAPHSREAQLISARVELSSGRIWVAGPIVEGVLADHPADPAALNLAGNIEMKRGRPEAAEAYYRRALAVRADDDTVMHNLASALLAQGRTVEAADRYAGTMALNPDQAQARRNIGLAVERSRSTTRTATASALALAALCAAIVAQRPALVAGSVLGLAAVLGLRRWEARRFSPEALAAHREIKDDPRVRRTRNGRRQRGAAIFSFAVLASLGVSLVVHAPPSSGPSPSDHLRGTNPSPMNPSVCDAPARPTLPDGRPLPC